MEQRTVLRFRKRAILVHWLHFVPFVVLLVTGALMFFDATGMSGGRQVRVVHQFAAAFYVVVPVFYAIVDPKGAMSFLKLTFQWERSDLAWLRASLGFYFGRKAQMPPQGYLNGDQRLWQLIVVVSGAVFVLTGTLQWFFKLKIPLEFYQWVTLSHAAAFVVILVAFFAHLYLTTLHTAFEESLSAMLDGKVSPSYARDRYGKWYESKDPGPG